MDALALLLSWIDEAFDKRAWHGTSLRGSLRGLDAATVARRPVTGRHNIWEVAVHAAYWKYAVRRRLTGEKRGSFALPGSDWFARPGSEGVSEAAWKADVALLVSEHRKLRRAVAALRPAALARTARGHRTTNLSLVRGIAAHDLYHAGQIQLLKRLVRS
jgi:uncharacterized damage-inducible protein DinB